MIPYPDIRVVRTQTNLREALIDLLQTSPYASVNVTDIAKTAKVNRVTFYNHYSSKDELMEEILDLLIEDYVLLTSKFASPNTKEELSAEIEYFIRINYDHYNQHAKVYKILLTEEFPEYRKKFIETMQKSIRSVLSTLRKRTELDVEDADFLVEWYVGGTVQTIRNYISTEARPSPEIISNRMIRMLAAMLLG